MKQKDIALVIVIGIVSAVLAVLLCNALVSNAKNRQQQAEIVEPISSNFIPPEKKYFSANSIDPTKTITIGNGENDKPFSEQ